MKEFRQLSIIFVSLILVGYIGCSKSNTTTTTDTDGDDGTSADLVLAVTNPVGDTLQGSTASLMEEDISPFSTLQLCQGVTFTNNCSSSPATRVRTFPAAGCTRSNGTNSAKVYGTVNLAFDSTASCNGFDAASSGTMTRTFTNHYVENSVGYKVIQYTGADTIADKSINALALKDYNGVTREGGMVVTKTDASTRNIVINGVHRRGIKPSGRWGFWHTIYTDNTGLTVSSAASNYTVNGTVYLTHNWLQYTATTTFTNVVYPTDGSCCYPTSGTITQQIGTTGTTLTTTFAGCGTATINGSNVTLPVCGGCSAM